MTKISLNYKIASEASYILSFAWKKQKVEKKFQKS